jgi:DNA adenine methylase
MSRVQPFLKWAGGKRWLVESPQLRLPVTYGRYIEPFLGSGALFFKLQPDRAILSDLNAELIETYRAIQAGSPDVGTLLKKHQHGHSVAYYYEVRASCPRDNAAKAARFIYLNRTCWNGLYRVNRQNEFNVPIGTKTKVEFGSGELEQIARVLMRATLKCGDFEEVVDLACHGDLLFLDPPYTANHNLNGFLKYNERIFSWSDQLRLKDAAIRAAERGAYVAITNANHSSVRSLFCDRFEYAELERTSVLAGKASARRRTTEALFTANF